MSETPDSSQRDFAFAVGRLKGELVRQCRYVILGFKEVRDEPLEEKRRVEEVGWSAR